MIYFCLFPAAWGGMYTKTLHEPVPAIVHISVLKILSITQIFTQYEYVGQREGIGRPRVTVQHFVSFPSSLAEAKCTWRKTSSCTAVQQRAQRPSSTCERCATASVFPLENTSLSPPPLSPTRMQTSICGCSLRNRLISSMFLPLISATLWWQIIKNYSIQNDYITMTCCCF